MYHQMSPLWLLGCRGMLEVLFAILQFFWECFIEHLKAKYQAWRKLRHDVATDVRTGSSQSVHDAGAVDYLNDVEVSYRGNGSDKHGGDDGITAVPGPELAGKGPAGEEAVVEGLYGTWVNGLGVGGE